MTRSRLLILMLAVSMLLPSLSYAEEGVIKGRILFDGTPPRLSKIEVKSDVSTCGTSKEVRQIMLGADQGVANAVVKIVGAQGTLVTKEGTLDQVNCDFVPHVQALPVGSILKITSSDPVLHNSHGFYEDGSTAFNIAVPVVGMEVPAQLKQPGVIKLRCDAGHTWMSAYVVVVEGPYYALTDSNGNFTIENIPLGNYELEVWHEWLGTRREPIVVKEAEREPITVTLRKS